MYKRQDNHNALHDHRPALFSGVYYAAAPPGAAGGELAFQLDASAGCSAAAPGAGTCSYGVVEPADGVLVVFPGGLKHAVFPMTAGPRPRVSISFNVAPT